MDDGGHAGDEFGAHLVGRRLQDVYVAVAPEPLEGFLALNGGGVSGNEHLQGGVPGNQHQLRQKKQSLSTKPMPTHKIHQSLSTKPTPTHKIYQSLYQTNANP